MDHDLTDDENLLIPQVSSKRSLMNRVARILLCVLVIAATEAASTASASKDSRRLQSGSASQSTSGLPFDVGVLDGNSTKEAQESSSSTAGVSVGDDQSVGGGEVFNSSLSQSGSSGSTASGSVEEPAQDKPSDTSHSSGNNFGATVVPTSVGNTLRPLTAALTLWIGITLMWSV